MILNIVNYIITSVYRTSSDSLCKGAFRLILILKRSGNDVIHVVTVHITLTYAGTII